MRGNEHLWWKFSAKIVNDFHPLKLILRKKNIIDLRQGFKYTSGNILCEAIKSETKYIFFLLHHICQNQEISIPNKLSSNNNK